MPIMIGGGEFIINGAERVVVSQLHRSPGVDFVVETEAGERKLHSLPHHPRARQLDRDQRHQEGHPRRPHRPVRQVLRHDAAPRHGPDLLQPTPTSSQAFYPTETRQAVNAANRREARRTSVAVGDVIDPETGEVYLECRRGRSPRSSLDKIWPRTVKEVVVLTKAEGPAHPDLAQGRPDATTHEEALLKIYQRLRPGNPPQLEKAKELFREKFQDPNRYRLGKVGRFRINRKFDQDIPETEMTLRSLDLPERHPATSCSCAAAKGIVDDIDHLGNRRLRTIDELAADELRKGFLKLRRTVQERMSIRDQQDMTPRSLINPKSISAAIEYFFGRGELSQVVDQTNPLAQLTHERRSAALGPGGLNRKRAGFEVRDVHISHYGRICPIETPEGTNIGLISSLSIYAGVDEYGFLITPYRKVNKRKLTDEVVWLRADEESPSYLAPADTPYGRQQDQRRTASSPASAATSATSMPTRSQYIDISPKQMVGVSAGLIPFLEHDDANRALMGSNMQRQAVPLLVTEPPLVSTGLEKEVATQ